MIEELIKSAIAGVYERTASLVLTTHSDEAVRGLVAESAALIDRLITIVEDLDAPPEAHG